MYVHPVKRICIKAMEKEEYQKHKRTLEPGSTPRNYVIKEPKSAENSGGIHHSEVGPSNANAHRLFSQPSRSVDLNFINVRFRFDPARTVNLDPMPDALRDLLKTEVL